MKCDENVNCLCLGSIRSHASSIDVNMPMVFELVNKSGCSVRKISVCREFVCYGWGMEDMLLLGYWLKSLVGNRSVAIEMFVMHNVCNAYA